MDFKEVAELSKGSANSFFIFSFIFFTSAFLLSADKDILEIKGII
ncbi:Uncharacterized protein dnl_48500 [Desulfonema limicola]|uniref:Uncharacterized protein n=1 Tax=Desulfonema limicola TaxID=45656 RepID=A0A975BC07_9BACT|nr:Uncharacterized protein dnl_48500 [Desulfonema limicola]